VNRENQNRSNHPSHSMKKDTLKKSALAIALALAISAPGSYAQQPSATPASGEQADEGSGGGHGGQRPPPDPEKLAARLLEKFDANKDGELSLDELTQALEFLRKNHPQRPGGGEGTPPRKHPSAGADAGNGAAGDGTQGPPPADKVAARWIEKFSSDKKGLTQAELAKALEARFAHRGQPGGGRPGGAAQENPSATPAGGGSDQ
jgi:hypothetical protein